jgi:CBS domain containing-hemolysin-like protein
MSPSGTILQFLVVLGLVMLNGFFVAAEFAFVKIRETQLDMLVAKGHGRAKVARHILTNLNAYLSATQLGITMTSLGLGWVGEPLFNRVLAPVLSALHIESEAARHSISFAIGFSVITFLHITAGELAPKWFAIQKSLSVSLWIAKPLKWFYIASYPFNWVLNRAAQWLLRQIGIEGAGAGERTHSEEELRLLVSTSHRVAGGTILGRDIVVNALDLRHRVARDVMRPRQEITFLDTEASITECTEIAEKTRYSRFPLCEGGNLDKTLGVVHIKDLYAMRLKARSAAELLPVARKLVYVPETARLERLLQLLLERKLHMAVVVDEYGGTLGLVTLENILEELVGQIQDEFDQEKPLLVKTSDTSWQVDGTLPLHELEEVVGEPLEEEGITTASGWVTQRLGGFPKVGEVVTLTGSEVRVEEMDGMRVARLTVRKKKEDEEKAQE